MKAIDILKPVSRDQLKTLSRTELVELLLGEQDLRAQAEAFAKVMAEEKYLIGEKYVRIKNRVFAPSSEKSPRPINDRKSPGDRKKPKDRTRLPSERYPDATIIEQDIEIVPPPPCTCCGREMKDSGMTETTECLSIIPKKFVIKRQIYHKYSCKNCHGSIETAPTLPRIKPGSSYDDDFVIDVAMSKYCDLIPIDRYASIAKRQGFRGLPPHSLIELTHYLADFLRPVYRLIKSEILRALVLHADETRHRMLEGSETTNWHLWGFSTEFSSYFEYHDTRSGDVAFEILAEAACKYLVSDVFAGYARAVRIANQQRLAHDRELILSCYCNAHARRRFRELADGAGDYFVSRYQEIYRIEAEIKGASPEVRLSARAQFIKIFEEMRIEAIRRAEGVSEKSGLAGAANYFVGNFEEMTRFLSDPSIPIDNNHQERQLRNPVIGRKTWFGTHSKRGAETAAILFSIVESCKINQLNPRAYLHQLVRDLHQKKKPYTPRQAALDAN